MFFLEINNFTVSAFHEEKRKRIISAKTKNNLNEREIKRKQPHRYILYRVAIKIKIQTNCTAATDGK